jgi:hypothetical protein
MSIIDREAQRHEWHLFYTKYNVTPEILNEHFAPTIVLGIKYHEHPIILGEIVNTEFVRDRPLVTWGPPDDGPYTLMMADFEAKRLCWCVVNIPINRTYEGKEIVPYTPPSEPNTGLHRVCFFLMRQNKSLAIHQLQTDNFDHRNFAREHHMRIAGFNMFRIGGETIAKA